MPNFVTNTITALGAAQIAATSTSQPLVITRVAVGSGIATGNPAAQTALVTQVMNLIPQPPSTAANDLQPGEFEVNATLDSANVVSPFSLTELGVFAKVGAGSEQLFCYCQATSPYDTINPGSGAGRLQVNVTVPVVVGTGTSVSITVQAGNPVFVPPVVAGPGIVVTAPVDALGRVTEWIVSTPMLTQSTTLFVKPGNPNVAPNFSSIQNAVNYLNQYTLAPGVTININVSGDTYAGAPGMANINHVNGTQINLLGQSLPDVNFTGFGSVTGSNGNWSVQLTGCSSTVNIVVGRWLNMYFIAGSSNFSSAIMAGFYQVTAISGSTVTVRVPFRQASFPSLAGSTGGVFTPISTLLQPTQNQFGIVVGSHGINTIQNIGLVPQAAPTGNNAPVGILFYGLCNGLVRCGVSGFLNSNLLLNGGFYIANNTNVEIYNCTASNNNNGITISTGQATGAALGFTNNLQFGIWIAFGGMAYLAPLEVGTKWVFVAGNGNQGINCGGNSQLVVTGNYPGSPPAAYYAFLWCVWNSSYGLGLDLKSYLLMGTTNGFLAQSNVTYDIGMFNLSNIDGLGNVTGTRIFNFTPGVLTGNGWAN